MCFNSVRQSLQFAFLVSICSTLGAACIFSADPETVDSPDAALGDDTDAPVDADEPIDVDGPVDTDPSNDTDESDDIVDDDGSTRDADTTPDDAADAIDTPDGGCTDGETRECGQATGACELGTQECVEGQWSDCSKDSGPTDEACNGIDDDCDGKVDEEVERECGESLGICEKGTQTCDAGEWEECSGNTEPEESESCNGTDDDCDGMVDEEVERECGESLGICEKGTQTCDAGEWEECSGNTEPEESESCNGTDDDCDGIVDEGCNCSPETTQSCGDDTGQCQTGTQECQQDGTWGDCNGNIEASMEQCDNLDNDCDGSVDEGCDDDSDGHCDGTMPVVGSPAICPDSPPDTADDCDDQNAAVYTGASEQCDGDDNDCDGVVDEGVQTTYFLDDDDDGYGDPTITEDACIPPSDYVENDDDCYDDSADARPGQTSWFTTDRGDGSYDYSCDGTEEKRWSELAQCKVDAQTNCSADPPGWAPPQGTSIPDCGVEQSFAESCSYSGGMYPSCSPDRRSRTQECR